MNMMVIIVRWEKKGVFVLRIVVSPVRISHTKLST